MRLSGYAMVVMGVGFYICASQHQGGSGLGRRTGLQNKCQLRAVVPRVWWFMMGALWTLERIFLWSLSYILLRG